jgi:septum formation protein
VVKSRKRRIILASESPRRKHLLKVLLNNFGLKFVVIPANIAEYIPKNASNFALIAKKLAKQKARQVCLKNKGVIIAADTIVVSNGRVLGKPRSAAEAKRMLRFLSGKEHRVYTGISIIDTRSGAEYSSCEVTKVRFRKITKKEIDFYVSGGSPMDKAGAYGIQDDLGSTFAEKITGDYFNIVGLPLVKTYLGLKKMKVLEI